MPAGFFTAAVWQGEKQAHSTLPECGRCGLYKHCHSPKMEPAGKRRRQILFVGEGPSKSDDEDGELFGGKSGQLLKDELATHDLRLKDCDSTNAVICHPPGHEVDDLYIECCRPNLLNTIRDHKPRVIVLLGRAAVRSLIPLERESDVKAHGRWVGWTIPSHDHQAWICPTWHPSYLLRMKNQVLNRQFREHVAQALALEDVPVKTESMEQLKARVERVLDPREARKRMRELAKLRRGVVSFDYECNKLKPDDPRARIASVSFSLDGESAWACPVWDDEKVQEALREFLVSDVEKDAANLKHEHRWSKAVLGVTVRRWRWDTMLAAHYIDNRKEITSLKFQAYVRYGVADYERVVAPYFEEGRDGLNRVHEVPLDDLLVYNGLDSLLEWRLARDQRKEVGIE